MKVIAVIPARYASTRLPAKLMADLGGKTVIRRTYENTVDTGLFDDVLVATDSNTIYDEIRAAGGKAVMSRKTHESGSDRIAEAVSGIDCDIVVNVQGDEPFLSREPLAQLLEVFRSDNAHEIDLASLMRHISDPDDIRDPNNVKVVTDQSGFALYFSRSVIPYPRDHNSAARYMQHIGVYAFRKKAIMDFATLPVSPMESTEKLEQLRYLENGRRIRMVETAHVSMGIDTAEDLERARKLF